MSYVSHLFNHHSKSFVMFMLQMSRQRQRSYLPESTELKGGRIGYRPGAIGLPSLVLNHYTFFDPGVRSRWEIFFVMFHIPLVSVSTKLQFQSVPGTRCCWSVSRAGLPAVKQASPESLTM